MQIICTNPRTYSLTRNNRYEVIHQSTTRYTIVNDRGITAAYSTDLFTVAPVQDTAPHTENAAPLPTRGARVQAVTATTPRAPRRAATPPLPPPRVVRTEQDRIDSITMTNRDFMFEVSFDDREFVDSEPALRFAACGFAVHRHMSFSCGISMYSGFSNASANIQGIVNYGVADYDDLTSSLFRKLGEALGLRLASEHNSNRAFILASDVVGVSDEILLAAGFVKTSADNTNPNSENIIAVWTKTLNG